MFHDVVQRDEHRQRLGGFADDLDQRRASCHHAADEVVAETEEVAESGEDVVESVKESVAEEVAELKEDLSALTVAQLKLRLKEAGLPVSGTKLTLINRLSEMEE